MVAAGTPAEIAPAARLAHRRLPGRAGGHPHPRRGAALRARKRITIHGARQHNLQNLTVRLPLGLLVAVTGRVRLGQVLAGLRHPRPRPAPALLRLRRTSPASTTPSRAGSTSTRSSPSTRSPSGASRAPTPPPTPTPSPPSARPLPPRPKPQRLGFTARHFSFNVPGGRCERCEGAGVLTVKMHFLPDVEVRCPACHGRRFTRETLAVRYRGHDIAQVLELTVEEALALFEDVPAAALAPAGAVRRRPGLPAARAARHHALGRRSPARQAGQGAGPPRHAGARSTCSTSPPPACTWRTPPACWRCCSAWWRPATP